MTEPTERWAFSARLNPSTRPWRPPTNARTSPVWLSDITLAACKLLVGNPRSRSIALSVRLTACWALSCSRGCRVVKMRKPCERSSALEYPRQFRANQVHKRWVVSSTATSSAHHSQRTLDCVSVGLCCNEPVAKERTENSVAPRQCPLWVAKRIVVRRSANDANQGRDFRDIQFVNRLVEIKLAPSPVHESLARHFARGRFRSRTQ